MNIMLNATSELRGSFSRKRSFRQDGSYRIFRITRKCHDDSDDENATNTKNSAIVELEKTLQIDYEKPLSSNHNGSKRWKRRSTKNKRLLFPSKPPCESPSCESKNSSLSHQLSNSFVQAMNTNDPTSKPLLSSNRQNNKERLISESSQSGALVEDMNEVLANDESTLNDLLARADQLEVTVQQQEFNKMQPMSRAGVQRKRKRRILACSIVLLAIGIIIAIIIFALTLTLRHILYVKQKSLPSSTLDQQRYV